MKNNSNRKLKRKFHSQHQLFLQTFSFKKTHSIFFTESSFIDFSTGTITDHERAVNYLEQIEDSNKVLLERSTREIAARIHRSTNLFDFPPSSQSLETERPIFATQLSDRTVTENSSSVKFTCSLLSTECDISWEKNGIPIRPSSKFTQTFADGLAILEIFDVSDEDAGKYSCIASNKFGENISSARLKVYSGFKPSVSMPPTVMRQMKGRSLFIYFSCYHFILSHSCSLFSKWDNEKVLQTTQIK